MGLILILLIAIVIFVAYHKAVKVWYFSFDAFIKEIITILIISSFLAMILISLLGSLLTTIGTILGRVFTVILFVVKWGLIIGIILLVGVFIKNIFFKGQNKNDVNLDNDLKTEGEEVNE